MHLKPFAGLIFLLSLVIFFPQSTLAATFIVTVSDNSFSPANLTIQVGDTVEWRNASGGNQHNVTADDGSFVSTTSNSFTFSNTFNQAGEFDYICTIHPNQMQGTITVEAPSTEPDLRLQSVMAAEGPFAPGSAFSINLTIENIGNGDSPGFSVTYYASDNANITSGDVVLGSDSRPALNAGQSNSYTANGVFPANLADGDYFIGAIIELEDGDVGNNDAFDPNTVTVSSSVSVFAFNAGLNGNWWGGPVRSGEGAQFEVTDGGNGTLVVVATVYSYDPLGNQIFMITVGVVDGNSVEVDVFITSDGLWGDNFDAALVMENQWGTGTFTGLDCESINMELRPNATYQALGYHILSYVLVRLTTPVIPCPFP